MTLTLTVLLVNGMCDKPSSVCLQDGEVLLSVDSINVMA